MQLRIFLNVLIMPLQKVIKFPAPSVLWIVTVILFLRDTTADIRYITTMRDVNIRAGLYRIVYVTAPSPAVARNISMGAVSRRMAACVNIIPEVQTVYEFEDRLHVETEVMMLIKTIVSRIPDLLDFIKKVHPFDVCEVITVPIANGNPDYLNWISDQCTI